MTGTDSILAAVAEEYRKRQHPDGIWVRAAAWPVTAHRVLSLTKVTKQVTTTPGYSRQSATHSDTVILPTCGNPTQPDGIGRNRHAW